MMMKIEFSNQSVFEDLQEVWNNLHDGSKKSAFFIFKQVSYDEDNDTLVVKHPNILDTCPLVEGEILVKIRDRKGKCEQMTDPTRS